LRDYKIKLATDAIAQCNGNKTLAAHSLSISRAYLHRLIRQPVAVVSPLCLTLKAPACASQPAHSMTYQRVA
jgi:hypothetical protein